MRRERLQNLRLDRLVFERERLPRGCLHPHRKEIGTADHQVSVLLPIVLEQAAIAVLQNGGFHTPHTYALAPCLPCYCFQDLKARLSVRGPSLLHCSHKSTQIVPKEEVGLVGERLLKEGSQELEVVRGVNGGKQIHETRRVVSKQLLRERGSRNTALEEHQLAGLPLKRLVTELGELNEGLEHLLPFQPYEQLQRVCCWSARFLLLLYHLEKKRAAISQRVRQIQAPQLSAFALALLSQNSQKQVQHSTLMSEELPHK